MTIIPPIGPYVPSYKPLSNISPFTYRDASTYVEKLQDIDAYLGKLREFVNENFTGLGDAFSAEIDRFIDETNDLITTINNNVDARLDANETALNAAVASVNAAVTAVNTALTNQTAANTAALAAQTANVNALNAALAEYVDDQVALIVGNSITVQDDVVAALVANASSDTRDALDLLYTPSDAAQDAGINTVVSNPSSTSRGTLDELYASKLIEETVAEFPDSFAPKSVETTVESGRLSAAALTSLIFGNSGLMQGGANRNFKIVSCALRNTSGTWEFINDTGHLNSLVTSVTSDGTRITINYSGIAATKVVGAFISPDETLAPLIDVGASVGLANSYLYLYDKEPFSDSISYNGSAWVSASGDCTATFSAGVITVNHPTTPNGKYGGSAKAYGVDITGRDGASAAYGYQIGSSGFGASSFTVSVRNGAGALVTTADTNMRFVFQHHRLRRAINPTNINETNFPGGNLWFNAILDCTPATP